MLPTFRKGCFVNTNADAPVILPLQIAILGETGFIQQLD